MSEHTELPWQVSRRGYIQGAFRDASRGMQDIAGMVTINNDMENTSANAALIVRAVNSLASNEAKIDALTTREKIYKAALERIAASRLNDFGTLHPEGCSAEAKQALHRAALSSHTEQESDRG